MTRPSNLLHGRSAQLVAACGRDFLRVGARDVLFDAAAVAGVDLDELYGKALAGVYAAHHARDQKRHGLAQPEA